MSNLAQRAGMWPIDARVAMERAKADAVSDGPLVSVVMTTRNAEKHLARAINSLKLLEYGSVEIILQDCVSTDRTLEIAENGGIERICSEPDQGALDGLVRAAHKASGEIIAVCWADDELLPHAVGWGVAKLQTLGCDVVYGDQLLSYDPRGTQILGKGEPWDISGLFHQRFWPVFSSSFFRKRALIQLGEKLTVFDHDEYEFWLWLGLLGTIRYEPGLVSIFHIHDETRWTKPGYTHQLLPGRFRAIQDAFRNYPDLGLRFPALNQGDAEISVLLWAALHELDSAHSPEDALTHLRKLCGRHNGDHRFDLILERFFDRWTSCDPALLGHYAKLASEFGIKFAICDSGSVQESACQFLENENARLKMAIDALQTENARLVAEMHSAEARIANAELRVGSMEKSSSWLLTEPLRKLKTLLLR